MIEGAAELGPAERLHPFAILTALRSSVRGMWGLFAAGGYFAVRGDWLYALIAILVWLGFSFASAIIHWRKFEFRVGAREIQIDSGLLSRRHRSIPFDRIQDVTLEQGPLARVLGLARVRFETGGGAAPASGEDEGALDAIPLGRAAEIRELVRASRGLAADRAREGQEEAETVFAMDFKRVLIAGTFNFSLAVVGALLGATQTFGDVIGFDPFEQSFWNSILNASDPLRRFVLANQVITAVAGSLMLIFIGLGTGIVRTLLRDYRFRLERTQTGLRRRRGLLTVTDVVLPAKRTQAVVIGSGPVRDRFGWSELRLQSLAKEVGGRDDHVVAPLAQQREIETVLGAIGWRSVGRPNWRQVSKAYLWAFAVAMAPLLLLAVGQTIALPLLGAAGLAAIAVVLAVRWLAWRRYAFAVENDRLIVRSGWWRRRVRILPLGNIQSIDYVQIFIDRWFGTAGLSIGVAGGGLAYGIKALPAESARQLRKQLLSEFL